MKLTQTRALLLVILITLPTLYLTTHAQQQQERPRSFPTLCKEYVGTAIDYFRQDSKYKE